MSYRWIKWIAVVVPAIVLGLWEGVRHQLLEPVMPAGIGNWVSACIVMIGAYAFVQELVRRIEVNARDAAKAWQETAVMRERQHLAREMHDSVAQAIFYLNVQLSDLDRIIETEEPKAVRTRLTEVRGNLDATYQRVRRVITDLRKAEEAEPFTDALHRIIREFNNQSAIRARLQVSGDGQVGPDARRHLLAIVQEALVNVDKHSRATDVLVTASFADGALTLTVTDNGQGFTPGTAPADSHGLTIMEERASLAGGELHVESAPGRGARLVVRLDRPQP